MLHHGKPWQAALGYALTTTIIFVVAMALSLVSGYLAWYSIMTALFLALGFGAIVLILPTLMNLSRSFFGFVFLLLIVQIVVTITSFAFHYMSSGLIANAKRHFPDFREAMYFSITTFTTRIWRSVASTRRTPNDFNRSAVWYGFNGYWNGPDLVLVSRKYDSERNGALRWQPAAQDAVGGNQKSDSYSNRQRTRP